jgi:DNA-binding response OmpR family regulator
MKIALLEPDLDELDRTLAGLSSAGHIGFGTTSDEGLRRLLDEVSVELFLLDWADPDGQRYATLEYLLQCRSTAPVVLYVASHTASGVIDSGLKCGATSYLKKPFCGAESIAHLYAATHHSSIASRPVRTGAS